MATISIVISAFNEEAKIERCIKSVQFADEVIIVDNQSSDKTATVAKKFDIKLYSCKNNSMLNVNKNFGFTKASSEWILSLDADEEISDSLAKEIRSTITNKPDIDGYWISRKNIIFGKWIQHGLWWPDKQLRLFRRNKGKFPCQHVHEYLQVDGKTSELEEAYTHYNYETISQFIQKMDQLYTKSEVEKLTKFNYQLIWYDAVRFPLSDFLKVYFAQEGYKDGLHGLVLAILQAFYSFVVFAKIWEKSNFTDVGIPHPEIKREVKESSREIKYWIETSSMNESVNMLDNFWHKILRRVYGKG